MHLVSAASELFGDVSVYGRIGRFPVFSSSLPHPVPTVYLIQCSSLPYPVLRLQPTSSSAPVPVYLVQSPIPAYLIQYSSSSLPHPVLQSTSSTFSSSLSNPVLQFQSTSSNTHSLPSPVLQSTSSSVHSSLPYPVLRLQPTSSSAPVPAYLVQSPISAYLIQYSSPEHFNFFLISCSLFLFMYIFFFKFHIF